MILHEVHQLHKVNSISFVDITFSFEVSLLGRGFLKVILECFSPDTHPHLHILKNWKSNYHHAPLFGFICGLLKVSLSTCERMYMRLIIRDLTSAAIRLNIIGPMEGCKLQFQMISFIESLLEVEITEAIINKNEDEVNIISELFNGLRFYHDEIPQQKAPMIDLLQARHGFLYSRLFSS
jgi:urease accessory protein UreF